MGREERTDGARLILQMVNGMAERRGIALGAVYWLPDPAKEAPEESSKVYTLVITAGTRQERQTFSREDLERAPVSEDTRTTIRDTLRDVVGGLLS